MMRNPVAKLSRVRTARRIRLLAARMGNAAQMPTEHWSAMSSRFLLFVLFVAAAPWADGQQRSLRDGDRVAFYGDSITAQRFYTRFVEDFLLTRYPKLHVAFRNAGVPGDTVNGGYTGDAPTRLKRDLFPLHPTVITVMLGMNDGYYMPFNQKYLDIYESGYSNLLASIKANLPGVRITLISPTPYDEVTHGTEFAHYNEVIGRHAAFVKELAASSHYGFSDFNGAVMKLTQGGMQRNASLAALLIPDRIHPAEASQWVMAAALARDWGMSPVVAGVHLDASKVAPVEIENTQIADLSTHDGSLQWKQLDGSLPLPLNLDDGLVRFVLDSSDVAAMDRQMLRVDHLVGLHYTLKIDGRTIASFDREQLAAGVNLALYSTPMLSQAQQVDDLEKKRAQLDEAHFVLAIEQPNIADAAAATKAIGEKDSALAEEQRKAVQPATHTFELVPE
jgi:lysophospholipase L1-like esterase